MSQKCGIFLLHKYVKVMQFHILLCSQILLQIYILTKACGGGGIIFEIIRKEETFMKKLMILGLIMSLFAFAGNNQMKIANAVVEPPISGGGADENADVTTHYNSVTLWNTNRYGNFSGQLFMYSMISEIIVTNNFNEIPQDKIVGGPVILQGCTGINENGEEVMPENGAAFAYITEGKLMQACYIYANADVIYANSDSSSLFSSIGPLRELDLSMLNTEKVENMSNFVSSSFQMYKLDISSFNTSKVTNMSDMFSGCTALTEINLSNFDTSNVTNMSNMFSRCTGLTEVDLSSFDISNAVNTNYMFDECDNLQYVKSPKSIATGSSIALPSQYRVTTSLTSENRADYPYVDLTLDTFVYNWRTLRTEADGICGTLVPGSDANTKLDELLAQYNTFDADSKKYVNKEIDKENVTVGESITYVKDVLEGKQATDGNYTGTKEDSSSFITLSIKEESPYLIAVISLIGILSVVGYYFYNKKIAFKNTF